MNYLRLVNHYFKFLLLLLLFFLLAQFNASAADVTVAWDANSESNLAGYKFFYGTSSRNYNFSKDVGNTTSYDVTNLVEGETYYFAAKAYDTSNNESDYSQELVYTLPVPNSAPNTPATPTGPSNGYVGTSYSFDTSGMDPDGDLLTYRFRWGDGTALSGWGGASSRTHTFSSVGTYCVQAKSQDTHGARSPYSPCHNISVVKLPVGHNDYCRDFGPCSAGQGDCDNNSECQSGLTCVQVSGPDTCQIELQKHSISASAGSGGSISPAGSVTINEGADQSFLIHPNQHYRVADVVVNGSSIGSVTSYTFHNVDRDHTIVASFVVENQPPVANAGADQTVQVNDTVQLDGSGSSDVDGDSLTFTWSFTKPDGSNAALSDIQAVNPTFGVDVAGTYTLQLIVNDGKVNSAPDTVRISTVNSAPVANAGADQTVQVNDTVQLDGSGSSDVDGDSLTFTWSFTKPDGSNAALSDIQTVNPTFGVDVAGTYTLQLIVNDGKVNSASNTVKISTVNSAPAANAGEDQTVQVNDTVQLDGSGSSDVDGDSLTFTWSFTKPDGSNAALSDIQAVNPTFDVDVAGTYTLQLIVNDGKVNSAPNTVKISTVNSAPAANAGEDQTVQVNDPVQLDGSGSSDVDGNSLTFTWSFVLRPDSSNATLSDIQAVNPTFGVDVAGTYIVQLIVNDGRVNSAPDTLTISTENSAPVSNAGNDQTVEEGDTVTLSGLNSTDPDDNIAGYSWKQTAGTSVILSNSEETESSFTAPNVAVDSETLTFQLTIQDTDGLQDVDTCVIEVTKAAEVDSDGDGVPDDQDAFPFDSDEFLDTDGDRVGNNADPDDDNDGMPDSWELEYGLNPLEDDAADDPDGDEVSNINEYNLGSKPDHHEGNFKPETPVILSPENSATVSLTPLLETGDFNDPNINDLHSNTQWKIIRAFDNFPVFDVTSDVALTSMTIPKQILEEDTEYIWQVRFMDNHGSLSEWSEERDFATDFVEHDTDRNGVPDDQEVIETLDLDDDGTADIAQPDIKCVNVEGGTAQACVSIRGAENVVSIVSLEVEDPNGPQLVSKKKGKPNYFEFGMLDFKLLVGAPGDETTVTIYLSKRAYKHGNCFKYDPVNDEWLNYSGYTKFSPSRKEVYLTLKDGGFGDADGIANGIIVDPLAFGSESDPNSDSSDAPVDEIVDGIIPDNISCFIGATAGEFSKYKLSSVRLLYPGLVLGVIALFPILSCVFKGFLSRLAKSAIRGIQKQKPAAGSPGDTRR